MTPPTEDDVISLAHLMAAFLGFSWVAMEHKPQWLKPGARPLGRDDFISLARTVLETQNLTE